MTSSPGRATWRHAVLQWLRRAFALRAGCECAYRATDAEDACAGMQGVASSDGVPGSMGRG
jgi:hypothetical protein